MTIENPEHFNDFERQDLLTKLAYFHTAVRMGQIAADLRAEAKRVEDCLWEIPFSDIKLGPGKQFRAIVDQVGAKFAVELTLNTGVIHEWCKLFFSEYTERYGLFEDKDSENGFAFIGQQMSYDPISKKVWLINQDSNTRLHYQEGIGLTIESVETFEQTDT
jgi:hypothetical protein